MRFIKVPIFQRLHDNEKYKNTTDDSPDWRPLALRWWNLVIAILLCWTFIAVLQYFLYKSQTNNGVLFAPVINELPLRLSFFYLYLPTIIAVIFSIFIVWIDHDAKRYEPYRLMARSCGALAKDSILLHYPFDFMPSVPFLSFKRRHWLVFSASTAALLTTFGVVPLQAGIFTVEKVVRLSEKSFSVSMNMKPASQQSTASIIRYAQSAYGILSLNETLPGFMTREYALTPFRADTTDNVVGIWTTHTTLYGMNLDCQAVHQNVTRIPCGLHDERICTLKGLSVQPNCSVSIDDFDNRTVGDKGNVGALRVKTFAAFFLSGFNQYIDNAIGSPVQTPCLRPDNGEFLAAFVRNKDKLEEPRNNITAVLCRPQYYYQPVEATVDALTKAPLTVLASGPKQAVSSAEFNAVVFQQTLAAGTREGVEREDTLPGTDMPQYLSALLRTDFTPFETWSGMGFDIQPILAMTIVLADRPLEDFLDPDVVAKSFEKAYKLLFARAMAGILQSDFSAATKSTTGKHLQDLEAVTLEPVFVYIVETLLALVSLCMATLLYLAWSVVGKTMLKGDPGSIAAMMSMAADSQLLLHRFEPLDCCSKACLVEELQQHRYTICSSHGRVQINEVIADTVQSSEQCNTNDGASSHPVSAIRPSELRTYTAIPFTTLFVTLMVLLAALFHKGRTSGLPLPSKSRIAQSLISEYLPTATATLIEPLWILINRLFCVLQPLDELRSFKASASRSLSLNYNSLPPQLTIFKAARAKHILLAAVCAMALLSNLLATAFAGLFFTKTISISRPTMFAPPFESRFVSIAGSVGPPVGARIMYVTDDALSGAYQGDVGEEQFLVAESNYTRNTSLPSWVSRKAMFIPFMSTPSQHPEKEYEAQTRYFAAAPNCKALEFGVDYRMQLDYQEEPVAQGRSASFFEVRVSAGDGDYTKCHGADKLGPYGHEWGWSLSYQHFSYESDALGKSAAELLTTLVPGENATKADGDTCRSAALVGFMRTTQRMSNSEGVGDRDRFEDAHQNNTFLMLCQPQLLTGMARVKVSAQGVLLDEATNMQKDPGHYPHDLEQYAPNGINNLIAQSNSFLFRSQHSTHHNDSFASEYMHYFMSRAAGDLRLTQPNTTLPTFADVEGLIEEAYPRLFSIWLGINRDLLFEPATKSTAQIQGFTISREERLFFTIPLFVISEVILGFYIIVAILVYIHRPGRYLPRMPISIAAIIALFAPSAAVRDFQGTSHMTNKERERFLTDLDCQYGYGSYIGSDGAVHVGIEKVPFVRYHKDVDFVGTRAETEARKRANREPATASSEDMDVRLEDGEGKESGAPTTDEFTPIPPTRHEYVALDPPGHFDDAAHDEGTAVQRVTRAAIVTTQPPRVKYSPLTSYDMDEREGAKSSERQNQLV